MAPPRQRTSTTRLPQSIIDEINAQSGSSGGPRHKRASGHNSRKAERKAERQLAKQRKAQFFAHGDARPNNKESAVRETRVSPPPRKKAKFESTSETPQPVAQKSKPPNQKEVPERVQKDKGVNSKERSAKSSSTTTKEHKDALGQVSKKRSRVEEEEDAYISMLEKNLGIKKNKKGKSKYGSGFEGDGLLDLLVELDEKVLGEVVDELGAGMDVDEGSEEAGESSQPDESEASDKDASCDEEGDDWTGLASEESEEEDEESDAVGSDKPVDSEAIGQNSGSKYVPPHLRRQASAQREDGTEVDVKLVRQLKGLLNRLSEQNINSILKDIENLYRSHRRHDITATLTNLIIEGTRSHSILLDSYVALHAGLVACLHKIIGVELAAYFVQNVISNFERHYQKATESLTSSPDPVPGPEGEEIGKECSNLLVLLSDLYNYRVISCVLIYDIIRLILDGDLSELDVELILKLARASGAQLRQDDPSALKDIIQIVQSKLGDQRNASSRTRFMVETLVNLKNNKLKRSAGGAQGGGESLERISKFVDGIEKKYHVHAHEPLRISLEDLRQADSKGKWWLVGAAWGGDPLVEQQASVSQSSTAPENTLLKLAKKQGMNTDVRRSVFIVLMSSDDYVDACDRLAQLNLTEVQQREIIRVLLHCCGNEKSYNPYYTLIAAHLCRQSHSPRVTLQYCFWDFLRSLGESNVGGADMARSFEDEDREEGFELDRVSSTRIANVARLYAWLAAKDYVAITILKTLEFISLKTKTKAFLKQFFTRLFANTQDLSSVPSLSDSIDASILTRRDQKALAEVLVKATRVPALSLGILHFLSTTFPQTDSQEPSAVFIRWCCQVVKEVLQGADADLL